MNADNTMIDNTVTPELEVTIVINSPNGDDRLVRPISEAVKLLKEKVEKYGQWIYVGTRRFRLQPAVLESVAALKQALTVTPVARVTGSLRGGSPEVIKTKPLSKWTKVELVAKATQLGNDRAEGADKKQLIAFIRGNDPAFQKGTKTKKTTKKGQLPSLDSINLADVELVISEDAFTKAAKNEKIVAVFVRTVDAEGKSIVKMHRTAELVVLRQHIASLILADTP